MGVQKVATPIINNVYIGNIKNEKILIFYFHFYFFTINGIQIDIWLTNTRI